LRDSTSCMVVCCSQYLAVSLAKGTAQLVPRTRHRASSMAPDTRAELNLPPLPRPSPGAERYPALRAAYMWITSRHRLDAQSHIPVRWPRGHHKKYFTYLRPSARPVARAAADVRACPTRRNQSGAARTVIPTIADFAIALFSHTVSLRIAVRSAILLVQLYVCRGTVWRLSLTPRSFSPSS
jgi:hypothetical protein